MIEVRRDLRLSSVISLERSWAALIVCQARNVHSAQTQGAILSHRCAASPLEKNQYSNVTKSNTMSNIFVLHRLKNTSGEGIDESRN
jgi:hypothetical protein